MFKKLALVAAIAAVAPVMSFARVEVGVGIGDKDGRRGDRQVACYAQSRRGETFSAVGRNPGRVQQRAVAECYQYARACRAVGCRAY